MLSILYMPLSRNFIDKFKKEAKAAIGKDISDEKAKKMMKTRMFICINLPKKRASGKKHTLPTLTFNPTMKEATIAAIIIHTKGSKDRLIRKYKLKRERIDEIMREERRRKYDIMF